VHLLQFTNNGWRERLVDVVHGKFIFVEGELSSKRLRMFSEAVADAAPGLTMEVNLAAIDLLDEVAAKLRRGVLLIADYGHENQLSESIQVRSRQRLLPSPFTSIGNADISAHVNWTHLREAAENAGLTSLGLADQHHFLTGLMMRLWQAEFARTNDKTRRELQTLLQPGLLGRAFQYAGFARDIAKAQLSGFGAR
jgi:SAM-dependent MidA family methyltransferase